MLFIKCLLFFIPFQAGVQNVRIVVVSDASVWVSWSPVFLPEITSYRVFYTPVPAARSSQWLNTTAASSPVLVSDLIPMSQYQFQVRAVAEIDGEEFLGNGSDLKMVATGGNVSPGCRLKLLYAFLCRWYAFSAAYSGSNSLQ